LAKEPEDLVLRLLREIGSTQEAHGGKLNHLEKRVEDLYTTSTHTLGVAANAHLRYETLGRIEQLTQRIERLEGKH
jgi:hypothetical protein